MCHRKGGEVAVGGFLWTCVPPNSVESTAVLLVQTYRACSRGPLSLVRLQGQGREELLMLSLGREERSMLVPHLSHPGRIL